MLNRVDIKLHARDMLRAQRGNCIGVYVLYTVLLAAVTGVSFGLGTLFLAPPLTVGASMFFLLAVRGQGPTFETMFKGFSRYAQSLVAMLWMALWTFLWSMLFVIPGIIKALAYSMTPYLVAEYPNLDPREALKLSMRITDGRKMDIFVFYLSFIGWAILTPLTFGILQFVFTGPYMELSRAGLYDALVADAIENGRVKAEELA